ncbi:cryptochrome/photolyase family protein [Blastochloris sulfoviridis]|uniref:Deoxyribodipyrimidine photo-lyase n=1 Tax=Blastochloris sulfoviridis TaxID=50712 RepID=A0A5M6I1Q8_9HYPH|nr:deoxyribodipyrimidine photo-lyase [Blastochloris sulfoviridis]KAA5602130.1 deoxyribodipyrimidine photo-lyase [Blastochloris sulfoviridis]
MPRDDRATGPDAPAVVWFRFDLRLSDNPALTAAANSGRPLVGLYVLDETGHGSRPLGAAARWWLAGSLRALQSALARAGVPLILRRGPATAVISAVLRETGAGLIAWNPRPMPAEQAADDSVRDIVAAALPHVAIADGQRRTCLLHDPAAVRGRVFTPFWKTLTAKLAPPPPLPVPRLRAGPRIDSDRLADWRLEPTAPDWAGGLRDTWTPGEAGAASRLASFLDGGIEGYATLRDRPDLAHVSMLSPHLRFGEITPGQVWHTVQMALASGRAATADAEKFLSELGWREFAYNLLHHHPDIAAANLQARFDAFPWQPDDALLRAWQRGATGYPIVDAGMRQLWRTGWMHNRVRMVVASFLVKHLLQDWRAGEAWFWDTLVDADPASNPASWQWVAGCGADAAPYFRIFNPILQGERFDPDGAYVRRFVPELAGLPNAAIHQPWRATPVERAAAGVRLGDTYPAPIVEHTRARNRALAAFGEIKSNAA